MRENLQGAANWKSSAADWIELMKFESGLIRFQVFKKSSKNEQPEFRCKGGRYNAVNLTSRQAANICPKAEGAAIESQTAPQKIRPLTDPLSSQLK